PRTRPLSGAASRDRAPSLNSTRAGARSDAVRASPHAGSTTMNWREASAILTTPSADAGRRSRSLCAAFARAEQPERTIELLTHAAPLRQKAAIRLRCMPPFEQGPISSTARRMWLTVQTLADLEH